MRHHAVILLCWLALTSAGLLIRGTSAHARKRAKPDLVLRARVTRIVLARQPPPGRLHWIIQTRVLKVLRGRFSGKRFDFRVHSPARSNLRRGKVITIEAWRTKNGWYVSPFKIYKSVVPNAS
jgi:hypothetical protein